MPIEFYLYSMSYDFEKRIFTERKCDDCKEKDAAYMYYSQTPSYYRNKSSGHFFFCSENCKLNFNRLKKCNTCSYGYDLAYIEKSDGLLYAYCKNYPFEVSCYDKYLCNYSCCSICYNALSWKYIEKGITFVVNEEKIVEICNKCKDKIRGIILRDTDSSSFPKKECCLCLNITNSDFVISRYDQDDIYFCKNCADIRQELTGLVFK